MRIVRGLGAWCRLEAQAALMFRAQLLTSVFGWVVPLAFMALWGFAASGSGVMTQGQTTAYYLVQLAATTIGFPAGLVFGFGSSVYSGGLSALLLMPFPSIMAIMAQPIVRAVMSSLPLVVVIPVLSWSLGADFSAGWLTGLAAIGLFLLGWVSTIVFCCVCGLSALWMGRWDAIMSLLLGIQWIFGGLIAPSVFMPGWLMWTMRLSPLWLGGGGAAELLSGTVRLAWWMPVVAVVWISALILTFRVLWPCAMRRFEAVGI